MYRKKIGTKTVNVPSHQQIVSFITELYADQPSVPRDVTGTVAITSAGSSTLPVSVIGLRFRGTNFSTVPVTNLSGNVGPLPTIGNGGGPGAVLLPQFVVGGGWASEIVMVNTGTVNLTVRVDLFKGEWQSIICDLQWPDRKQFYQFEHPRRWCADSCTTRSKRGRRLLTRVTFIRIGSAGISLSSVSDELRCVVDRSGATAYRVSADRRLSAVIASVS